MPINTADTANFVGLAAGTYYAFLEDTLGCFTYSDTIIITQPDTLILTEDSTTLTTCFSDADGTASILAVGGTTAYSWLWDAAAGSQTSMTAVGLATGTYAVTVTDANGCTDVTNVTISSPFPSPAAVTLTTTPSTTCTGNGSATVFTTFNMVGDANLYTYQWSNSTATGPTATGLIPGPITVTVTDINGCVAVTTINVPGNPASTIVGMPTINPGCNQTNGQITVVAVGDSAGYTYQWSPNALGQTTALVVGLGVGTYTVTVTGASNGCTSIQTATLVNNSSLNIVGFNTTNPTCGNADGTIEVLTIGATGPLVFNWTGGSNTNPATGLAAGPYIVTVTDPSTNCSDIADTILVGFTPTASFTQVNNASCNIPNGSITVTGAGAPGPFTYLWSNGQTNATAQGLGAGTYTCTVTYQGCSVVVPAQAITNDTLQIAIDGYDDLTCNNDLSSFVNVAVLSGNAPSFLWSNGATTQNISAIGPGTYSVTATSGTCAVTQSIVIQNINLTVNPYVLQTGQVEASIQINDVIPINGGVSTNYFTPTYTWTQLPSGIVTIADSTAIATDITGLANGTTTLVFTAVAGTGANAGPCVAVDSIWITVESYMGMPTAFTPNNDGINDYFRPASLTNSDKVSKFEIYNRWGQLLYSDNVNYAWDGTYQGVPQPVDSYIYVFVYEPDDGTGEGTIEIRGEFTLIR